MSWFEPKKSGNILSHESIWIITWESTWIMSWICGNSWKATWVLSWIDSSLRDTAWVMSWFKSIYREGTWVESPSNGHRKWTLEWKAPKKVNRVNSEVECPPKNQTKLGINSIIGSWVNSNQDSGKLFLSHELIWIKSFGTIVSRELNRIKKFWDWVESNKKWVVPMSGRAVRCVFCVVVAGAAMCTVTGASCANSLVLPPHLP